LVVFFSIEGAVGEAGAAAAVGSCRDGNSSEGVGIIDNKTRLVNFELGSEGPEQAIVAIALIRNQAGVTLLCPLRQKVSVNLIGERNISDRDISAILRLQFKSLDGQRVRGRSDPDINVNAAIQGWQSPACYHVTPISVAI
tara:strand:- start:1577 stop:1999 length:423 start_codon:yes stop_codon:yes gene_type:complete